MYLYACVSISFHEFWGLVDEGDRFFIVVADLWKAPVSGKAVGTSTAGSSEAIMLGGLAMKKRWQEARKAAGKDHFRPNIVFGANAQVALEKFARYFDVETRLVPVKAETGYVMDPKDAIPFIDENTIGVMVILGSTYTGHFEDVQEMSNLRTYHLILTNDVHALTSRLCWQLTNCKPRPGWISPSTSMRLPGGSLRPFHIPS